MFKGKKKYFFIFLTIILLTSFFFLLKKNYELKNLNIQIELRKELKEKKRQHNIKKYENKINDLNNGILKTKNFELNFNTIDIPLYNEKNPFGYLDFYKEKLIFMYANGRIIFIENYSSSPTIREIKTNFQEFNYTVEGRNSYFNSPIRDILVSNDYLYVVYFNKFDVSIGPKKHMIVTKQNSHIVRGKLDENLGSIKFEKFFYPNEYIEHYGGQGHAGGRLVEYKDDYFLMAHPDYYITGDAREIYKIQDPNSNFGKLLKINMKGESSLFSIGHRNTQGLFYDKKNDQVFSTEHGPTGGDEINLVIEGGNYGWPTTSIGVEIGITKFTDHEKQGFIAPIYTWKTNPGASQIIRLDESFLKEWSEDLLFASLTGSMVDKSFYPGHSIYRFKMVGKNQASIEEVIFVNSRIRDLIYDKKKEIIILALENQKKIGLISKNK